MTTQLDLFGEATQQSTAQANVLVRAHLRRVKGTQAPHNGTATSRAAARAVTESGQQATQIAQVLRLINKAGERGTTRADIAHALGKPQSTVCARVNRLMQQGAVIEKEHPRLPDCGGSIRQKVLVGAV